MLKSEITIKALRRSVKSLGYAFFENGDFNLNIIGIRTASKVSNTFDDFICVAFKDGGDWNLNVYESTTDPGVYWRQHPINRKGAAILVPGQHRGSYRIGAHQGKYDALVQAKMLPVFRDNNKDGIIDVDGDIDTGWHGINMHRASHKWQSKLVNKWSAGCQVFASPCQYDRFMSLCKTSASLYGPRLTYTLIEEKDLI